MDNYRFGSEHLFGKPKRLSKMRKMTGHAGLDIIKLDSDNITDSMQSFEPY